MLWIKKISANLIVNAIMVMYLMGCPDSHWVIWGEHPVSERGSSRYSAMSSKEIFVENSFILNWEQLFLLS